MMKKNGLVLIMALWLMAIMSIFGVGLSKISWASYRFAKFRVDRFLSLHAMNTVFAMCKFDRMTDDTTGYDTLSELPNEAEYKFDRVKAAYALLDEEGKININKVGSAVLKNLPGMDMDKAIAVSNSKLKPFHIKEELLLVDGINEEDYAKIKDLITVYGEGRVNINTCSEGIMDGLGMEQSLIERIMKFRNGEDDKLYTEDDGVFESSDEIIGALKEKFYLSLSEEQALASLVGKLGTRSDNYQVKADIYVDGALVNRYSVIFGKKEASQNIYYVKEWREY